MECADGCSGELRQLDGAHLGAVDGAARAVGGEDGGVAASMTDLSPSNPSRAPRELEPRTARKVNRLRMRVIKFAVEALADEDGGAGTAVVDGARQHALVPEAEDARPWRQRRRGAASRLPRR